MPRPALATTSAAAVMSVKVPSPLLRSELSCGRRPDDDEEIQVAVVIDVDERGGLRHVRGCRDARRCRDVLEPPVGLLLEEPIASGAKDEQIRPAVVVVVGGHSGDRQRQSPPE